MTRERGPLSLSPLFDNLANCLTQATHMEKGDFNWIVDGTPYDTQVIIHVDWASIVLPCVVEVLVLLYLLIMMILNRGRPVWKDSTVAPLCQGLVGNTTNDVCGIAKLFSDGSTDQATPNRITHKRQWSNTYKYVTYRYPRNDRIFAPVAKVQMLRCFTEKRSIRPRFKTLIDRS